MRFDVKSGVKDWGGYSFVLKLGDSQRGFAKKDAQDFFYGFSCLLEDSSNKGKFSRYSITLDVGKYFLIYQAHRAANDLFGDVLEEGVVRFDFSRTICPRLLELRAKILNKNPKFRKDLDAIMRLIGSFEINKYERLENPRQYTLDFS